jgi:hypothetical protein
MDVAIDATGNDPGLGMMAMRDLDIHADCTLPQIRGALI